MATVTWKCEKGHEWPGDDGGSAVLAILRLAEDDERCPACSLPAVSVSGTGPVPFFGSTELPS